jgi:hypothetical protein
MLSQGSNDDEGSNSQCSIPAEGWTVGTAPATAMGDAESSGANDWSRMSSLSGAVTPPDTREPVDSSAPTEVLTTVAKEKMAAVADTTEQVSCVLGEPKRRLPSWFPSRILASAAMVAVLAVGAAVIRSRR